MVFGEVLFDHFPDGSRVLGGAPFNLAWHLQAVGLDPLLITRVGTDREGDEVIEAMTRWGLDLSGVQRDRRRPTGAVHVCFDRGEPLFEIPPEQAWDDLEAQPALNALEGQEAAILCHGSLVARGEGARAALGEVREKSALPVFVDVNLRDPHWTVGGVTDLLAGARWAKLNERELLEIGGERSGGAEGAASGLRDRYAFDEVWVTRGAAGALVASAGGVASGRHRPGGEVVDTVGAGDAFSAVVVAARVWGWSPERTLRGALAFAARVCTIRGATGSDRRLYAELGRMRGEESPDA